MSRNWLIEGKYIDEASVSSISDPRTLQVLYRVLDESLAEIVAARPPPNPNVEMEIRIRLAEIIIGALQGSQVDPVKLKQIAVRAFAPTPEDVG
jgi:hypothetical protein